MRRVIKAPVDIDIGKGDRCGGHCFYLGWNRLSEVFCNLFHKVLKRKKYARIESRCIECLDSVEIYQLEQEEGRTCK